MNNLLLELLESIRYFTANSEGGRFNFYGCGRWQVCQKYLAQKVLKADQNMSDKTFQKLHGSIDVGDPAIVHQLNDKDLVEYHALVVRRFSVQR